MTLCNDPIASLINKEGTLTSSDKEKANVLNEFFASVFTKEDISNIPNFSNKTDIEILSVDVTLYAMKERISKLKINKAAGPDEMHPKIIK